MLPKNMEIGVPYKCYLGEIYKDEEDQTWTKFPNGILRTFPASQMQLEEVRPIDVTPRKKDKRFTYKSLSVIKRKLVEWYPKAKIKLAIENEDVVIVRISVDGSFQDRTAYSIIKDVLQNLESLNYSILYSVIVGRQCSR